MAAGVAARGLAFALAFVATAAPAQEGDPALAALRAPPRVVLHAGAEVGDVLERTIAQQGRTLVERTVIVARSQDGLVVERSGSALGTYALRLHVDGEGNVRRAEAGRPGARELAAIDVAVEGPEEAPELLSGSERVVVPAGEYDCLRYELVRDEPLPTRNVRWLARGGPLDGMLVRETTEVQGARYEVVLTSASDATERVGARDVPCLHLVRRTAVGGLAAATVEEWVAREPLLFGERLVRLQNGLVTTRVTALGRDGRSVFALEGPCLGE